jgi:hypothetical protein
MSTHDHGGLDRRDFLKLMPVGAASLPLAVQSARAAGPAHLDDALPLAYWGGAEADAAAGRVRDARALVAGDARFLSRGARLTLHGLYPSDQLWAYTGWRGFEVDVVHDPVSGLRHHAWCCENRHGPNVSSSLTVRVPVAADHGLCLAGAMRDANDERVPFSLRLSAGAEDNVAKLRPGLYLAALRSGGAVNWRHYRIEGDRQLYRLGAGTSLEALAPFPYLAFSVSLA